MSSMTAVICETESKSHPTVSRTSTPHFPIFDVSISASKVFQSLNELNDKMKPSSSSKSLIKISIGDPTIDGNLTPPDSLKEELIEIIRSDEFNGYPPVLGYDETRQAVAEYCQSFCQTPERKALINWNNVVMTSGVSHGIELAIAGLCNPGDAILVPEPCFPHYQVVCSRYDLTCIPFHLDSTRNWECDLAHAADLLTPQTRVFVNVNPSNPCGSNYSRKHLEEILEFCETHKLGMLSDEIYGEIVFEGSPLVSVVDFDSPVPRVVMSGASKWYICPGWRIGWAVLIDPEGVAEGWMSGMDRLAQMICGPNSICQVAVGRELMRDSTKRRAAICQILRDGLMVFERLLEHDIGISFAKPCASMFIMLGVNFDYYKDISTSMEFYEKLLDEENVQLVPGEIFGSNGFVRATICRPLPILNEAINRIILFCKRHMKS
ncbi:unnamed protein product [Phytomonas sp. Hart1]|nr:unnamed protein product [Phytomonas sp. Hart1]|eukprot:CCW66934.1 unnamed protein product [Phytomonas sp. isolate Hart1]